MMEILTCICHLLLVISDPRFDLLLFKVFQVVTFWSSCMFVYTSTGVLGNQYIHTRIFVIFFDLTPLPSGISPGKIMASGRRNHRTLKLP